VAMSRKTRNDRQRQLSTRSLSNGFVRSDDGLSAAASRGHTVMDGARTHRLAPAARQSSGSTPRSSLSLTIRRTMHGGVGVLSDPIGRWIAGIMAAIWLVGTMWNTCRRLYAKLQTWRRR